MYRLYNSRMIMSAVLSVVAVVLLYIFLNWFSLEQSETFAEAQIAISCGHYYVGIDIPEGTYNVRTLDDSLITITNNRTGVLVHNKTYGNNFNFKNGDILYVGTWGLGFLETKRGSISTMYSRNNPAIGLAPIELLSGTYSIGIDIPKGWYNIAITNGKGHIRGSGSPIPLDIKAGTDGIKFIRNEFLNDGGILELIGVSAKLTPSLDWGDDFLNEHTTSMQQSSTSTHPSLNSSPEPDIQEEDDLYVYYTETGSKYHYENLCGNGTYYLCTLSEAISKGLGPCGKCVAH